MVWLTDVIEVSAALYPQSAPVSRPVVGSSAVLTPPTSVPTTPPRRPPIPPRSPACAGGAAPAVRPRLATATSPAVRRIRMAIRDVSRSATKSPPVERRAGPRRTLSVRSLKGDDQVTGGK